MSIAYVFLTTEAGSEGEVLKNVRMLKEVKEAYVVYGIYDIVIKVKANSMDELKDLILSKIRKITRIRSTLTIILLE